MGCAEVFCFRRLENKTDKRPLSSDDVYGEFELANLANENPIFRGPAMHNEVAFRLDSLDDGMNGKIVLGLT